MHRTLITAAVGLPLLAQSLASPAAAVLPHATLNTVATITVGERPITPVLDEARGQLYVANSYSASISVISTTSNAVTATIDVGTPLDDQIQQVALDSARRRLFALLPSAKKLLVIDTGTNTVLKTIVTKGYPTAMVLDAPRGRLYVLTEEPTVLLTLAPATGAVIRTVAPPKGATVMSLNPDNGRLYMNEWRAYRGSIVAVDPRTARIVWRITDIENPSDMVPDPDRSLLYVPLSDDEDPGTLLVLDTRKHKKVASITVGMWPGMPVLDPTRNRLYLVTANEDTVTVIDTLKNTVIGHIATGIEPFTPVLDASATRLFVTGGKRVLMIDLATNAVVARGRVTYASGEPVINSAGTRLYVANWPDLTESDGTEIDGTEIDGTVSVVAVSR